MKVPIQHPYGKIQVLPYAAIREEVTVWLTIPLLLSALDVAVNTFYDHLEEREYHKL